MIYFDLLLEEVCKYRMIHVGLLIRFPIIAPFRYETNYDVIQTNP